jgi:nucleoside-diphosphate-sugar epimerase
MSSGSILVTGATGFIGRCLLKRLRSMGYPVFVHSRAEGDLASCALEYPEVGHVFHLAARSYVPDSWADPRAFYETNLLGTVNILEFCRRHRASMTFVSSYVYGRPLHTPVGEDHPLQPFNPYSHSKILAEEACGFYSAQHNLRIAIVRPFNVYGPGQDERFLIPILVRQALDASSETIEVADDRPRRDFLFVSDLVDLLLATFQREAPGVYNAGSGSSVGIGELVRILNGLIPRPKQLISRGESRPQEIPDLFADISKAKRELGWEPSTNLESGLRLTIAGQGGGNRRL